MPGLLTHGEIMDTQTTSSFQPALLQQLPCGIALLAPGGRITWVNETLCRMLDCDAEALTDKSLDDLPTSVRHLLHAKPHIYAVDKGRHWIRRELHGDEDGQQLLVLTDISAQEELAAENARLRQQVDELKLTDDLTGLPNKRAISQSLDLHISRSRRYQNPLSVLLVSVDLGNDGTAGSTHDARLLAVSRFLRDRLRWVDQIARWSDRVFLIVLPETSEADARGLLDKVASERTTMLMPDAADQRPRLAFGLACWGKGDDMRTLLRSAVENLNTSLEDGTAGA
jgi:diguanylate cyclase (GGDEF)-like protein